MYCRYLFVACMSFVKKPGKQLQGHRAISKQGMYQFSAAPTSPEQSHSALWKFSQLTSISSENISFRISGFLASFSCCSGSRLTTSSLFNFASRPSIAFSSFFRFLNFFAGSIGAGGFSTLGLLKQMEHEFTLLFSTPPDLHFGHGFLQRCCSCSCRTLLLLFGLGVGTRQHQRERGRWSQTRDGGRGGRRNRRSQSRNVSTVPCFCYTAPFGLVCCYFILKRL